MQASARAPTLLAWLLAVCCLARAPSLAGAESNSLADEYTAVISQALAEVRAEHFAEARTLFARAHALYPNARTLRGLAMMAFELQAYAESLRYFEEALSSAERPLDPELRADSEARMKRARRSVTILRLVVTPANLHVSLDEQEVLLSSNGELRLDAGPHTLAFATPGYQSQTRALRARGGESLLWTIALELTPQPVADARVQPALPAPAARPELLAPAPSPIEAPAKERPRLYKNPWLWLGVGVVVAAAAFGTGFGIAGSRHARSVEMDPVETRNSPPDGIIQTLWGVK
jgi:tetratricopeptide (TPR) repeat protein